MNITLARIDDRLIHGQVTTVWSKVANAQRIIICNDHAEFLPPVGTVESCRFVQFGIDSLHGRVRGWRQHRSAAPRHQP